MGQMRQIQTNFSSGEIDPLMHMRVDTGAYQNGAASLLNAALYNTGGAGRRAGTIHMTSLPGRVRLEPFEFSSTERYILAFEANKLHVYSLAGVLLTSVTVNCNWAADSLFDFTYAQVADVMIVAHRNWNPQIIRRTGATTFTVSDFAFDRSIDNKKIYQPYYKFADDTVTLTCSATTGSVTVTASAAVFSPLMVGSRIRWHDVEIELGGYTSSTVMTGTVLGLLQGTLDINPFRTTTGSAVVEVTHVAHGFASGQTITLSVANNVGGLTAGALNNSHVLTVLDDNRYSIDLSIYSMTATDSVDGGGPNVKFKSSSTATRQWSEPAFSARAGWPGAVAFHEGRLWFGGTPSQPDAIWSSKTFEYFNFAVGDGLDDESIQVTIGADDISNVRHLVSHRDLQIFTATAEFFAPSPSNGSLTPATMKIKRQTPYGSSTLMPQLLDGATIYLQSTGTAVREYLYSDGTAGYNSTNLNILSAHLLDNPVQLAVLYGTTERSEQYAFAVNADGSLAVFHSARSENLAGWTKWAMNGASVTSLTVIGDTVFMAVLRGGTYRLEMLGEAQVDSLDGSTTYRSVTAKSDWVVDALYYGKTVKVNAGNYHLGEFTVGPSGALALPVALDTIVVGYDYPFEITSLPVNVEFASGTMFGRPKRISRVILGLNSTLSVSLSGNQIILRQVTDDFSQAPAAYTGTYEFFLLGYSRNASVTVTQSEPLPCRVLGMVLEVTV